MNHWHNWSRRGTVLGQTGTIVQEFLHEGQEYLVFKFDFEIRLDTGLPVKMIVIFPDSFIADEGPSNR